MKFNSSSMLIRAFLLSIFTLLFTSNEALAGTLRKTPEFAQCDYLFSGEVTVGDALEIENVIPARASGTVLCLNSPGGSFPEGLRMFHAIWNKDSLATRVRNGDRCLSACSIAFLGGSLVVGSGAIRSKNTVIEPGSSLGFHAPSLIVPNDDLYDSATVQKAYALALASSAHMFELTEKVEHGARGMSDFLYLQTLVTPPESMYNIDTVGKANLAGIPIANIPFPELSWSGIRNVCNTAVIMKNKNMLAASTVAELFNRFSDSGQDGSGRSINFEDRTWSWQSESFRNFVIRGYPAPHNQEMFCRVSISKYILDRELSLPLSDRDATTHHFSVTLSQDRIFLFEGPFSEYAENHTSVGLRLNVPWISLWDPMKPIEDFVP